MPKNIELYFQWVNYIGCGLDLNKAKGRGDGVLFFF